MSLDSLQPHQNLLRCLVGSDQGELSLRFVEQTHFRLWQYLLANKHNLRVHEAIACLWLNQSEFEQQQDLYIHAGNVEPLCRLSFSVYDDNAGWCDVVQRFLPAAEKDEVKAILLKKIPASVRASENFMLTEEAG